MKRGRKIVAVAHCILNVNAKVYGIAQCPSGATDLIKLLMDNGYGIIQLPCIEQAMCGIMRWGTVKNQLDFPAFRDRCHELLNPIVNQIKDFANNGYKICGIIGVDGSPTCGVDYTCIGDWYGEVDEKFHVIEKSKTAKIIPGKGVMICVLRELLARQSLDIPFFAIDEMSFASGYQDLLKKIELS